MALILDGKKLALEVQAELKEKVKKMVAEKKKRPVLAVVLVGEDAASKIYVRNKQRACEEIGIASELYTLSAEVRQESLEYILQSLAERGDIDGILLQMPLPDHLDAEKALLCIPPEKDVDAFHPINAGFLFRDNYHFLPCTPAGIMELLAKNGIDVFGKECVVVGQSNIVGKPMAVMLIHAGGTVTACHKDTADLRFHTKRADILVTAVGKPHLITGDMVKEGAVVVDVGITRDENGKLCGDVEFAEVEPKAAAITPVPGGVGPMTVAILMKNTVMAAELALEREEKAKNHE